MAYVPPKQMWYFRTSTGRVVSAAAHIEEVAFEAVQARLTRKAAAFGVGPPPNGWTLTSLGPRKAKTED